MPTSPPAGWTRGLDITIAAAQIPASVVNVPVVFTASAFTSTFLNALQVDGADLRFTSDATGTNFLPRHIQFFDRTNGIIIVHVKLNSVTASTAKTIYAWAGNSAASEPLPRSASGYQSVYNSVFGTTNSYYGDCQFQNGPTSGTLFPTNLGFKAGFESTGNWTPVNNDGGITQSLTGPLPGQRSWILANSNNITNLEAINSQNTDNTRAHWFEFWWHSASFPPNNGPIFVGDFNRYWRWDSNGRVKMGDSGSASTSGIVLNQWNQVILSRDASGNVTFYLNGNTNGTTSTTQDIETMNRIFQDRNNNGTGYSGARVCWIRVCRGTTFAGTHVGIQYRSVANYLTFASASNETVYATPSILTITGLISGCAISIWNNEDSDAQDLGTLLASDNALVGTQFTYAHSGVSNEVIIQMIAEGYEEEWISFTLGNTNQTLPISPKIEENL